MTYDPNNVFARILRGEIPCKKVYEDEFVLAFHDINPLAPTHILVIPKGAYVSMNDFTAKASDAEIAALFRTVGRLAAEAGLAEDGWRMLANIGANGHQEVPHLHVHIFGGRKLGHMLPERSA
ncbi:histidine triad nucleotide-binding protein [Magnetospirillum moscoviense]|uniref:Histidine triad nucleotide-binding protein n=1 Tax=Magnetospirillum moscoviense TaxID=1437059 RepID=A0A178MZL0_9PROT|nr:histidine triad nucleotide-binding protein [Magnetospirillum moscoviense]OAN66777.1 histidine triad nucleotide-binding protein [Magnetospirillum moscoviense]